LLLGGFTVLPQDPIILLSYVNTKLRDQYSDLDDLCTGLGVDKGELVRRLDGVGYTYSVERNQFI